VPVLARLIEESGIATVIVTMMPAVAEKFRLARVVGVESLSGTLCRSRPSSPERR
jgi:hypothetical protein